MLRCDFCLRVVSSGTTQVECAVCNVVVHAACLRRANQATTARRDVEGGPDADIREIEGRGSLLNAPKNGHRDSGPLQPSDFAGGVTIFDSENDKDVVEDGGVLARGSGGSCNGGGGGGGCPDDERAMDQHPSKWVCSHCTKEHYSSIKEQGEFIGLLPCLVFLPPYLSLCASYIHKVMR